MNTNYEYDVALSFAGENREYVKQVAQHLSDANVKVFYDEFEQSTLWGKNLYDYLHEIYTKKAEYTMMFISESYKEKAWTNHERESAQARAFNESKDYILPIRFDNTEIPGMNSTVGYLNANDHSPQKIAELFLSKKNPNSKTIEKENIKTLIKDIQPIETQDLDKESILLKEASLDSDGSIHLINALSGLMLQTNNKNLIKSNHRREIAQWEEALESLVYKDLLKETYLSNGHKMFEMTNNGYKIADNS